MRFSFTFLSAFSSSKSTGNILLYLSCCFSLDTRVVSDRLLLPPNRIALLTELRKELCKLQCKLRNKPRWNLDLSAIVPFYSDASKSSVVESIMHKSGSNCETTLTNSSLFSNFLWNWSIISIYSSKPITSAPNYSKWMITVSADFYTSSSSSCNTWVKIASN